MSKSTAQKHKVLLRKQFLSERMKLDDSEVKKKSACIIDQLIKTDEFKGASVIHTYVSITSKKEADTISLITYCLKSGKRVVVPKMMDKGELKHIEITTINNLKKNDWGILEPENNNEVNISDVELIVVPMVAADRHRNRLGYGKGYYDRFLSKVDAFKTGLLFEVQFFEELLPVDSFDVPLDKIITEKRII